MSTTPTVPDRDPQSVDETRGDYVEMTRQTHTDSQAAAGAAIEKAFYLDGRLAYTAGSTVAKGDTGAVLRRLQWVPNAAITGAATNNFSLLVNRYNAGVLQGGQGAIANIAFAAGTNGPAFVPIDLSAFGFVSGWYLAPGDVLTWRLVQAGTGLAAPTGLLVLEYARLGQ